MENKSWLFFYLLYAVKFISSLKLCNKHLLNYNYLYQIIRDHYIVFNFKYLCKHGGKFMGSGKITLYFAIDY